MYLTLLLGLSIEFCNCLHKNIALLSLDLILGIFTTFYRRYERTLLILYIDLASMNLDELSLALVVCRFSYIFPCRQSYH